MKLKVENLTQQVMDLKNENIHLKAQITDIHTLKVFKFFSFYQFLFLFSCLFFKDRLAEREKEVRRLLEDISKLENARDKQAVKISTLQDRIHSIDDEANRASFSSDNAVRNLSNELRFLKSSLEQVTERERRVRNKYI